ncbi:hypothetical protein AB0O01_01445 [Streptomyces sp. NPDC093252]|uniref:hypothetical protein n=1 Tax=Streptomyces sp. NPDC093252 TaxID=3154980 RepID=UPI0034293F12
MTRKTTAAVLVAAGILALSGCYPPYVEAGGSRATGSGQAPEADALLTAATRYQEAANAADWPTACVLSSTGARDGTIRQCADRYTLDDPTEEPSAAPSSEPLTYADGPSPEPVALRTSAGPGRADTGPVAASDVVEVPALGTHPAGYGVLVTFTLERPGEAALPQRVALRLVQEGADWLVDQHEGVRQGDMGHGSPVRAALSGR